MAKIRQEINIIDAIQTGTAAVTTNACVLLDTTQFSGTVTYYFEIVGRRNGATCAATLRRKGTSTDDATATVSDTDNVYRRYRSSSFTPPAGQTEYVLQFPTSVVNTANIKSARIIIIQESASISNTETQIEIGNEETAKTNTVAAALTNPKYWKYNAAQWDGSCVFYVEITWLNVSSMDTTTVKLQKDGGSDNFTFSDDTTIVNAATQTTATRTRVQFTPTDGRNYQISTVCSSSMNGGNSFYNAKIIVDSGNGLKDVTGGITNVGANFIRGATDATFPEASGQSFTAGSSYTLTRIDAMLTKSGSPTDQLVMKIRTGSITGTLVATSDSLSASSVVANGWNTFTFSTPLSISSGTKYYVTIERSPDVNDTVNFCGWVSDNGVTANGGSYTRTSGVWSAESTTIDLWMRTYITPTAPTKIEAQYLLANTGSFGGSTGLKDSDTYYDPAEWSADSGTITYIHEGNGAAAGTGDMKLQQDPNGTPADVTNSTITDTIQREQSSAMTMPGSAQTIDVNVTGTGTLNASRILVQWVWVAAATVKQKVVLAGQAVARAGFF